MISVAEVQSRTEVRTWTFENWTEVQFKVQPLCWTGPEVQFRVQQDWRGSNRVRTDTGPTVPSQFFFQFCQKNSFPQAPIEYEKYFRQAAAAGTVHKQCLCNCSDDAVKPLCSNDTDSVYARLLLSRKYLNKRTPLFKNPFYMYYNVDGILL